jgi:hypothetical protein
MQSENEIEMNKPVGASYSGCNGLTEGSVFIFFFFYLDYETIGTAATPGHFCPSQNPRCPPGFEPGPPRWVQVDFFFIWTVRL